jgi:2,4-dichlorophenol 6-monooxygenase
MPCPFGISAAWAVAIDQIELCIYSGGVMADDTHANGADTEIPVLIVGAGPAGLALSLALARYGVLALTIDKHPSTAHTPRAHIINQRTVEIFRALGISEKFHELAIPQSGMSNNLWVTTLAEPEVARSQTWGTAPDRAAEYLVSSPEPMANCPQTVLEPMLLAAAREAGANIQFDTEFVEFRQSGDGVTSVLRDRTTGDTRIARSRYVIGADGARSRVLTDAGLTVDGPDDLGRAANIWFRANLARFFDYRPGVLTWNVMPGPLPPLRLGTLICHRRYTEFVLAFMFDPQQTTLSELAEDALLQRIRAVVGEDIDAEILGVAGWQVRAQIAPRYSSGKVFCMGDAVHRHPPTNGLGLNMSYNLAWKLALVLDGRAGQRLLDSYSTERQPVGAAGVERAITSLRQGSAIEAALGLEPGQSAEDGWKALKILYEPGVAGDERRRALRKAIELSHYQFNAHGIELGYCYQSEAITDDPTPPAEPERDPVLYYTPTTRPGARVPHARLERAHQPMSSLDLLEPLGFTLFTGVGGSSWRAGAEQIAARVRVPVTVRMIGERGGTCDPYGDWASRCEVDTSGCVLVRPDGHVAWRAFTFSPEGPQQLSDVVDRALGLTVA